MSSPAADLPGSGLKLRYAALIAGVTYLTNPVMFAEVYVMPRLVGSTADQTVANISAHSHLFAAAILAYVFSLAGDVVLAWSLYVLLAPVNRALSQLAAWMQLVYAAATLAAVGDLGVLYRLIAVPAYASQLHRQDLLTQATLLLAGFHAGWGLALILFGMHLLLVGWLITRSNYVPRWLGWLLTVNGLAYIVDSVALYTAPDAPLKFLFAFFTFELVFMVWLLGWGARLPQPAKL